ncbi:hypothetical protein [Enterococcus phage vB_EfaS_Ef2.2]|nr:hypothetical protein [Enterococcus phage vB_EfaS_Ef2.2]
MYSNHSLSFQTVLRWLFIASSILSESLPALNEAFSDCTPIFLNEASGMLFLPVISLFLITPAVISEASNDFGSL